MCVRTGSGTCLTGADSIVVSASGWQAGGPGSIPGHSRQVYLVLRPGSQHCKLYITRESENHVKVGPISIWDVN